MTDHDYMDSLLGEQTPTPAGGRRAQKNRRRGPGCLIALVILAVLGAVQRRYFKNRSHLPSPDAPKEEPS